MSEQALFILGACVAVCSLTTLAVRFPAEAEEQERQALQNALLARDATG